MPELPAIRKAPRSLPLAGHAVPLLVQPLEFLKSLPALGGLVRVRMGPDDAYVPCDPALFRQILKDTRLYDKGGLFYDRGREAVGNGLVTSRWADHRRQRPLMQPSFNHRHLGHYAELMADETEVLMRSWRSGEIVDVDKAMARLTLRITTRSLFSVPADHALVTQVEKWLPILMDGFFRRMFVPARVLSLVPTKMNRLYPRAIAEMRKLTEEIIDEVRRKKDEDPGLLASLMDARDETTGAPLDTQEIFDQVLILLIAGSETTATALAFTFHLLGAHPGIGARLREEVDGALGGRTPRFEDLSALPYTRQVLMESLRLYPPAWMFTRSTTTACELGGHAFPEGTTFLLSPYILQHDPELFPRPERFDPDRWAPGAMSDVARRSVVPFGAGGRKCIGDQFALNEALLAIAGIAGRWDLTPVGDRPVRPIARATLKTGPLPMRLRERPHEPVRNATTTDLRDHQR
ncbi:cytochrome P450 [Streptomyces rubiginosohelvolus]|uniref:cytochrome P450 n=1 Tax=Streptomyces rubiginosohelvolus TaxID=67362 RepID=UPI0013BF525E|nr:cytochrome P450 [Streptomyces sp. SID6648]